MAALKSYRTPLLGRQCGIIIHAIPYQRCKAPPTTNAFHASINALTLDVDLHALVVKSISPGLSSPSEVAEQVQLPEDTY